MLQLFKKCMKQIFTFCEKYLLKNMGQGYKNGQDDFIPSNILGVSIDYLLSKCFTVTINDIY